MEDHRQRVAERHLVGGRERLDEHHLVVAPWIGQAPRQERELTQRRAAIDRDRHDLTRGRVLEEVGGYRHVLDQPHVGRRDPRDRLELRGHCARRALERGEHVAEAAALVVGGARVVEAVPGALQTDLRGHAGCDHRSDGDDLATQADQIAEELAVQRPHQRSSAALARSVLRVCVSMEPSASVTTRCAIAAIGALWVITAVVVPSSRLTRSITSSTRMPVR